jgi:hypothetical protein
MGARIKKWKTFLSILLLTVLLTGCGQSPLDDCIDSKAHLWNSAIKDNRYDGNERYWNAVKECEDKYR